MKDPLLLSYSLEELLYEYHSIKEGKKADAERAEEENDKIEEAKQKEAADWADKMEEEEEKAEADPSKDPNNAKWMAEQMKIDKEMFGTDFGEDLSLDFEGPNKGK